MDSNHTCLAVISLDSALKKDENYYLKVFFFFFFKLIKYINDNLNDFSSSDYSDDSDED